MAPFLLLVLLLSLPFWLLGQFVQAQPLPGLPVSALMAFVPALAAMILTARSGGSPGVRTLLGRSADAGRLRAHARWWPLVLLMPVIVLGEALLADGLAPRSAPTFWAPLLMLPPFFVAALGEELGWSGYLLERLERRLGELAAGLLLGSIWAAWHVIPYLQAGRPLEWIAWQCAQTIAVRLIMVRLYFGAGRSVFAVAVFHALSNVAAFSLPLWGGTYDPRPITPVLAAVAAALFLTRRR